MNSEPSSPVPTDWRPRRQAAREACEAVASRPDDRELLAIAAEFASDPKWEVRKVVADALALFPEGVAKDMSALMAGETHHMVEAAIRRSLTRRQFGGVPTPGHEGLLHDEYEKIRSRHGQEAADAAREMAEKSTALHLRAAVHDIRNIITALNPSDELAADPKHKRNVNRIIKARGYLKRMLDMMDKYSSPLSVKKSTESIRDVIEESLADALGQIKEEGYNHSKVNVRIGIPNMGSFSVARLEIVIAFTNLIKNAIEAHGRKAGEIQSGEVDIGGTVLDGFIQIHIQDRGKGLSQSMLDDLLQFIPGQTSKRGGSGYGLSLCNRYITAHGGRLALESQENVGTTATVFLPIPEPAETIL